MIVPPFPLLGEPGTWSALVLVSATIALEAETEPFEGQLGVGWVIRRRAMDWGLGWHRAVLGADGVAYGDGRPYEPFSCWNDDYRIRAEARLSAISELLAESCWKAASGAIWETLPDPVGGADHYLNVDLTKRIRGGSLPAWAAEPGHPKRVDPQKVRVVLGQHTFLRV